MPHCVAILGPGLLGASLALALRRRGDSHVSLWARREETVREISERGFAELVSRDLQKVIAGAETIVLCTPIGVMAALAREIVPHLAPRTLVTDVGSVKAPVVADLNAIFAGRARFIGSHPMAGSDKTGHATASASLFDDRVCILTPNAMTTPDTITDAIDFWQSVGCRVATLSPSEHDEVVALVSHLPHLLAATLMHVVAHQSPNAFAFHGPGFFDHTRVAAGAPEMWAEILRLNRDAVRAGAEAMIEKLREITTLLDRERPMTDFLTQAKALRDALRAPNHDV
jgi:prephenate dehydrogenase